MQIDASSVPSGLLGILAARNADLPRAALEDWLLVRALQNGQLMADALTTLAAERNIRVEICHLEVRAKHFFTEIAHGVMPMAERCDGLEGRCQAADSTGQRDRISRRRLPS
jgi:hypothetical protein